MDLGTIILLLALLGLLGYALAGALGAFTTLSAKETFQTSGSAGGTTVSSALPFQNASAPWSFTFTISYAVGSGAGQVQEEAINIQTISASSNATINLQSLTDILGTASVVLTKIKAWMFVLLSATQDSTNGTACSSVTFQGGASNPNTLSLAGTTPTYTINNGAVWKHADGGAAGVTVSAGACNIKFVNNDGANAAAVFYQLGGA